MDIHAACGLALASVGSRSGRVASRALALPALVVLGQMVPDSRETQRAHAAARVDASLALPGFTAASSFGTAPKRRYLDGYAQERALFHAVATTKLRESR